MITEPFSPLWLVPNAPCGVESEKRRPRENIDLAVPNAPCGVESLAVSGFGRALVSLFLMHRVELKE